MKYKILIFFYYITFLGLIGVLFYYGSWKTLDNRPISILPFLNFNFFYFTNI